MSARWGTVVVPINEKNHLFWDRFKQIAKDKDIPYTRALRRAAELWLVEQGESPLAPATPTRTAGVDPFVRNAPQPAPKPPKAPQDTYVPPPFNPFA